MKWGQFLFIFALHCGTLVYINNNFFYSAYWMFRGYTVLSLCRWIFPMQNKDGHAWIWRISRHAASIMCSRQKHVTKCDVAHRKSGSEGVAVYVSRGHVVHIHKQHVSFSDDDGNRRHSLLLAVTFIFQNQPEIWAKHKNPSAQAVWRRTYSAHIQLIFTIQNIRHKGNNNALFKVSVQADGWVTASDVSFLAFLLLWGFCAILLFTCCSSSLCCFFCRYAVTLSKLTLYRCSKRLLVLVEAFV